MIEVLTNNDYEPKENEKVITQTLKTFISVSAAHFRGHFYKNVIKIAFGSHLCLRFVYTVF